MNNLAMKHMERLSQAARRLARDIYTMRNELGLKNLYQELYAAREARFTAVVQARCRLKHFLRENPGAGTEEVRVALQLFGIPETREELTEAIRSIERGAVAHVRNVRGQQPVGYSTDEALKAALMEIAK